VALAVPLRDLHRAVGRTVIAYDYIEVVEVLREDRVERLRQKRGVVIGRDEDRDVRRRHREEDNNVVGNGGYGEVTGASTHRVWVGAAGTTTAFGLIRSLSDGWGETVHITAADTNPPVLVASAAIADVSVQVPQAADPAFPRFLMRELEARSIDTYVPIHDTEISLAAHLLASGDFPEGVTVRAPCPDVAERCCDKFEMARWLAASGLPTPTTWTAADAPWAAAGRVVKPRRGVGSVGVRVLRTKADLERLRGDATVVVQELCDPPEITLDVFASRAGTETRVLCRERLEVKSGVATKVRIHEDPELAILATTLVRALPLPGLSCFQVMRDGEEGGWTITDVNPRHGAGTRLGAAVGIDLIAADLAELWGEDPSRFLGALDGERYVVRQWQEFVVGDGRMAPKAIAQR
jgi:carbamoyl-phosphate synthase large subunit